MSFPRGVGLLAIIAVISVALNLFLAGNQLGRHFRGPMPPMNFLERLSIMSRDLPEADRVIARAVLDRHSAEIQEKWRAVRPAMQRAGVAMHADPFDAAEAKAAYEKANERSEELRKAIQDMLIETAQSISAEGRERLRVPGGGL